MQPGDYTQVIYDRGCLRSGEEWVERNLVPVAAVAVALAVLQARKFSPVCRVKKLSNPTVMHSSIGISQNFYHTYLDLNSMILILSALPKCSHSFLSKF